MLLFQEKQNLNKNGEMDAFLSFHMPYLWTRF